MPAASANSADLQHICLTPTKNEAWVMPRFLPAATYWASHVIVADQGSTDGTAEMVLNTPGAILVRNEMKAFDERHRQNLLIDNARKIAGRRVLIALDADEALSANCLTSPEWEKIAQAKPGTVLRFRWVNIMPGFKKAWVPPAHTPFGFIDDGSEHKAKQIHSTRIPTPADAPVLDLNDIVVLHFQYVAWDRVISKHRWYQAWERLNFPEKSALDIYRQYHHMYGSWAESEMQSVRPEWVEGYEKRGVDYRSLKSEPVMWWDREILELIRKHGKETFRKIDMWDKDWNAFAESLGKRDQDYSDPRSATEKLLHRLLASTQKNRGSLFARFVERFARMNGW